MSPSENMNDPRQATDEDGGIDLSEYLGMLFENRWLIGAITALFTVVALVHALFATPIYRADALVQIEQGKGRFGGSDELTMMMGGAEASSSSTEIEILKSRNVLGDVVNKSQLTIAVQAKHFPLIGDYIARKNAGKAQPVAPWFGLGSYAWGGERLNVSRLDVSGGYTGAAFTLVAGEAGHFALLDGVGEELLRGRAGEAAASSNGQIQIFVSELVARSGTQFFVSRLNHFAVVRSLQAQLQIAEKGRGTGMLEISMDGADRERIRTIVHSLSQSYLRQNVERRSEESEKMLAFINRQMPVMRTELDAAEQALNLYRERSGTIDLSIESQNLIQRVTRLETEISALGIDRAELLQKLTDNHPVIHGIDEKLQRLQEQMERLEGQLKAVPEKELESVKLSRDVKVASELYMLLLNKSQELKVTKAGTLGSVRIVDEAVVGAQPHKPNRKRIVFLGMLLGLIFGVVIAVLRKALNKVIDDPSVVEKQFGYPVYAEIPFSTYQGEMIKNAKKQLDKSGYELLAHTKGDDHVIESLRSLRTSLQFALMEAENNLVTISGPAPEVGKSFVSSNFAYVLATSGKKVLLIDADMRKGHLANYFKIAKSPGLSETLSGEADFASAVHRGALHENLDFLATGVYPPNPSELLMSDAFKALLGTVQAQYDLVIIDTPPVLAVTDPTIVGQYAATNFMLLRSGQHQLREIQTAFRRFEQNGVQIRGAIFNGVDTMQGRYGSKYGYGYGYGYKYYAYQYGYK